MDSSIHDMERRKLVEQLNLGQRTMMVTSPIRRFLERMGMDNRCPILDMDVRKK